MHRLRYGILSALAVVSLASTLVAGCVGDAPTQPQPQPDGGVDGSNIADASDASGDTTSADTSISTWCTNRPEKFCWDFDKGLFDDGWGRQEVNGTVTLNTQASSSAPNSAAFSLIASPTAAKAQLFRFFPGATSTTTLAADLKPVRSLDGGTDAGGDAGVLPFPNLIQTYVGSNFVLLASSETSYSIAISAAPFFTSFGSGLPSNKFTRVSLKVVWSQQATGGVEVLIDGNLVFSKANIITLGATTDTKSEAVVGIGDQKAPVPAQRYIADNITFDY